MIFSFAAYHLWLHWRFTADFMARHFIGGRVGRGGVGCVAVMGPYRGSVCQSS